MTHSYEIFGEMPILQTTKDAIAAMGFSSPTPIQKLVISPALKKRDIFGQAQTGTGKTLAFAIPIVESIVPERKVVQAIVLTPTRELARQVAEEVAKISKGVDIEVVAIYGGQAQKVQVDALQRGAQIVVGTPGRLVDLIKQGHLRLNKVTTAILDEVDEMLDMGFYEEVEAIFAHIPRERQTMFFSATIPAKIQRLGRTYLKRPVLLSTSDESVMAETNEHIFYEVFDKNRLSALCDVVDYESVELGLVFCRTKIEADRVTRGLQRKGYKAEGLHGDMPQAKREKVMKQYRTGQINLLVATNVAARGIDVQGVTHVINYHIPMDAEVYVHRSGRTGRAGAAGRSITFVSPSEYYDLVKIQEKNNLQIENRTLPTKEELFHKRMEKMFKKIKEGLKTENISEVYKMVKKEIPLFWRGKALAFLAKKYIDNGYHFLGSEGASSSAGTKYVRLFLNAGKNHGANIDKIKDFLIKKGKIKQTDLHKIDVLDKYSFVNVKQGSEQQLIKKLAGQKFDKYNINIEISRSKDSGSRGGQRSSNRGRNQRPSSPANSQRAPRKVRSTRSR